MALLFIAGLGVGAIAGINLPNGAACTPNNLACRWLRWRYPKMIVDIENNENSDGEYG